MPAHQIDRLEAVADLPAAFPHRAVVAQRLLGQRQHEEQGVLGDGRGVGIGRDCQGDAAPGQRRDVDVVVADAMARDDFEALRLVDHRGGQRDGADRRGVGIPDLVRKLRLGFAVDDLELDVVTRFEKGHAALMEQLDDQNFRHRA
jgi:hypothetical protein